MREVGMDATVDLAAIGQFSAAIGQWDQGTTCLTALALAVDPDGVASLRDAARDVVTAAGLGDVLAKPDQLPFTALQLRGMVASPVLQGASLLSGDDPTWDERTDSVLLAQGHASGSTALLFAAFVLPEVPQLAARLGQPGARMLDVGAGIGALAIGFAELFPQLHITGIDVMARVLALARAH